MRRLEAKPRDRSSGQSGRRRSVGLPKGTLFGSPFSFCAGLEGGEEKLMKKQMLIVDDEPKVCDCLAKFFMAKGFAVTALFNGAEAIEWLMEQPADIIIVDVLLPDMMGTEVLKRTKELCPEAKVIMMTALTDDEPVVDAEVYGAAGFIHKPFDLSELTWASVFETW